LKGNNTKILLSKINKLIANYVVDEEELGDIYDILCRHIGIPNKTDKISAARFNNQKQDTGRKLIAVGFDGVVHSVGPNKIDLSANATVIQNPPVPNAIEWLSALANDSRFFVTIYSARAKILGFEKSLQEWLVKHGMDAKTVNKMTVSSTKPSSFLFIDDRSWKFNGKFPRIDDLLNFRAWHEND
jgi:hypothetical protein